MVEIKNPGIVKILILIIPILVLSYLVYVNLLASHEFNYVYDIGNSEPHLTPLERISQPLVEETTNLTYINLQHGLVYFNVPTSPGSKNVNVKVRFKGNIEETFRLGARNNSVEWNYQWKDFSFENTTDWQTSEVSFDLSDKYISNNQLSMILRTAHLLNNQSTNYISVDRIDITVYKPGIFNKENEISP